MIGRAIRTGNLIFDGRQATQIFRYGISIVSSEVCKGTPWHYWRQDPTSGVTPVFIAATISFLVRLQSPKSPMEGGSICCAATDYGRDSQRCASVLASWGANCGCNLLSQK